MAFSGKITTISCQINLSDCNHLSNGLIFRLFYRIVVRFVRFEQRFNQFNFGHYKKWVIDVDKMLMYLLQLILCMLLPTKKKTQILKTKYKLENYLLLDIDKAHIGLANARKSEWAIVKPHDWGTSVQENNMNKGCAPFVKLT